MMLDDEFLGYVLFPITAPLIGGAIAIWRRPGLRLENAVLYFTAGMIVAALASEVLPEITHQRAQIAVLIGCSVGILVMLVIRQVIEHLWQTRTTFALKRAVNSTLGIVDMRAALHGLLLGIGFAASIENDTLLMIALTGEALRLGMTLATAMLKSGTSQERVIGAMAGLAGSIALGIALDVMLLSKLTGTVLALVLSFGAAALLSLIIEALFSLLDDLPSTPPVAVMFFVGFLTISTIAIFI